MLRTYAEGSFLRAAKTLQASLPPIEARRGMLRCFVSGLPRCTTGIRCLRHRSPTLRRACCTKLVAIPASRPYINRGWYQW